MVNFEKIESSIPYLAGGIIVTLQYTIVSLILGFIIGAIIAILRISHIKVLRWFAKLYVSIFRGTPLLVQLVLVYHGTPELTGYQISAFEAGVIAFSLNSAAYVSEIIRAGIESIDIGQTEAAHSFGVPYLLMMKDIILPQAIKNILPALVNEMVNLLKETAIISVIGGADLMRRANIVAAEKYIFFEPLIVIAVFYYILVMIFSKLARWMEIRLQRSD